MKTNSKKRKAASPSAIGTGLLALDYVISADKPEVYNWAGGTCGNVLIILSFLGWKSAPVARLGDEKSTELLLSDLDRWDVSKKFIRVSPDGSTPIIVERIRKDSSGRPRHSFSWRCAACGAPFPGYRAELVTVAEQIATKITKPSVFFFDRASPGALILAKACAAVGALVVFEPIGVGNESLFRQSWQVAHIVKYSHERLTELPEVDLVHSPQLVIETLGDAGLRYRRKNISRNSNSWVELKAFPVDELKDTAGAGDWCTAGILSKIGSRGQKGFSGLKSTEIENALKYGQALAAWNCRYEGARGGMYSESKKNFHNQVEEILSGTSRTVSTHRHQANDVKENSVKLCRICDPRAALRVSKLAAS